MIPQRVHATFIIFPTTLINSKFYLYTFCLEKKFSCLWETKSYYETLNHSYFHLKKIIKYIGISDLCIVAMIICVSECDQHFCRDL